MNEIEFIQWVDDMEESMRHVEGGVLYMTDRLFTGRERELAEAELERRRQARWVILRHGPIDDAVQNLLELHHEEP